MSDFFYFTCALLILSNKFVQLHADYEGSMPKFLQQKYGLKNFDVKTSDSGGTKTYTKTKNTKTGGSQHISKFANMGTKFRGGCNSEPPIPINAGIKCSQYSGCSIECFPNYQFPNGAKKLFVTCQNSEWKIDNSAFETLPPCEPICLPTCLNNGICYAPNQCDCPENFSGPQCQFENKPCLNRPFLPSNSKITCRSSICTTTCTSGYQFPDGSTIAQMICKNGNWVPAKDKWVTIPNCEAICNPPCQNGGNCLSFNTCQCPQDFRGPQCQYRADVCSARKLKFNGGYNCTGNSDIFSCSIKCPEGIPFEFQPVPLYTCSYSTGIFSPIPIPQCIFAANMQYFTSGSFPHKIFDNYSSTFNMNSMTINGKNGQHNFGTNKWNLPEQNQIQETFINDSSVHFIPMGLKENQYVLVEEKLPEPGICFTWSGHHFKTFDGKIYSFDSKCAYTLVRDAIDNTFSIITENNERCSASEEQCYRKIKIYLQDKEFILKKTVNGLPMFKTPKKILPIPGQMPGIRVEMLAHFTVISLDGIGLKLKWDGKYFIQIEVKENLWNRTEGLCGRIDGNQQNDLANKDGTFSPTITTLALNWQVDKVGDVCNDIPSEEHSCQNDGTKISKARKFCEQLLQDTRFKTCQKIMDVSVLLEACIWDYCLCDNQNPTECACETLSIYVEQCTYKGIKNIANWRDENTCPMKCDGGKIYMPCGPIKGQPVCGAALEIFEENERCIEGCYCPEGTVLHQSQCITKNNCPCRLRGKDFPPGFSVPKDCNTCTCLEGQWICTQVSCGARCSAIGDPHYTTFDGKRYDFMGQCSYYLIKMDNFSLEAENVACPGAISQAMNFPLSISAGLPSCTKTVTIRLPGKIIKLKQDRDVIINGQEVTKIPYSTPEVTIRIMSSLFLQVRLSNGAEVWWDGVTRVYVDIPATFKGKTKGLCGTFNNNQKDDFLTPENDIEQSTVPFANKWKTSEKCNDIPNNLLSNPCEINIQNKITAENHCKKLKSDLFKDCHWYVDPEPFYQNCLFDMCSCETKASKCLCPILAGYAQECSLKGIKINWRNEIRECGIHCSGGQKYQVCGNSCTRTCYDISLHPDCKSQCIEGCNCPEGESLNDNGECIPTGQCSCQHQGLEFPAGYQEVRPASKAPELCTCVNAIWTCRQATPSEIKDFPSANDKKSMCSAAKNMEFTTCEPVEQTTCKNMHVQELFSAAVCHPGCKCKNGYVLDTIQKTCVKPTECPCHHGGQSYKDNSTVQNDCNTCTCKNGKWQCTDRQCAAECSAWGDSHFKTFDGKLYDYQGQCDYIFAKGILQNDDSFDIAIQNVPCSSLGVSCSKSVTIKIGTGPQQESVILEKEKPLPNYRIYKRLTIRTEGLFVILEVSDLGLIIRWDKGTRIYVKLDPRWKNRVKGLCGNYNDDQQDDFQTPSGGITEVSANIFGDSWRLQPYCPEALEITSTCDERPDRKVWALKKCSILKSSVFAPCHSEVPIDYYLERCIFDTCACDQGGDCECLCTALAAYAQECNNHGVPIKWRSQQLCPIQCDERCAQYSPCISTCPLETCDNLPIRNHFDSLCKEDTCIEGCQPKLCPPEYIYLNSSLLDCVPRNTCKPVCLEINEIVYYEGDLIEEDECHSCYCSRAQKKCKGVPCTTSGLIMSTPEPQKNQVPICYSGWTDWINQDKEVTSKTKFNGKPMDVEPIPDGLVMNNLHGPSRCNATEIVDIKCRTVKTHMSFKETGLNVECSLERGLICKSDNGTLCPDFEIQVLCECEYEHLIYSTVVPEYAGCDVNQPNQQHPSDCHLFYQCVPGIEGPELVEKTCGGMMYNPNTQVCDWPDNVIKIRNDCGEKKVTVSLTENVENKTERCPPGEVYDECALNCQQMCTYYLEILRKSGKCKEGTKCVEGCVSAEKKLGSCSNGMLWANSENCVLIQDCLCISNDGKPVKPGVVYKESDCEVCQCIDNYYACDVSNCLPQTQTPPQEIATTSPITTPTILVTITPPKKCDEDKFLNLIQGDQPLPDDAFSASSNLGPAFEAKYARIDNKHGKHGDSWSPKVSNKDQYLQINFNRQEPVYGVIIKGSPLFNQYVTSYKVLYSPDGHMFEYVFNHNKQPQEFVGSVDSHRAVKQLFDIPVEAKAIRVNPQTWHNSISLMVELIGCGEKATTKPEYEFITTGIPHNICTDPMGVGDGMISDQQITVSSEFGPDNNKKYLKVNGEKAWQPLTNSPVEWVEFDFLEPRNITGFVTKGGPNGWVSAYNVEFSHDNKLWNPILDSSSNKRLFPANFDQNTPRTNHFDVPVLTRYIKLIPQKWKYNIQMRIEPHGCFISYPEEVEEEKVLSTPEPIFCNHCSGVQENTLELNACRCNESLWWDGENCVPRNQCPCIVGHIPYAIGTVFEKEDCSECICKLGGVSHCTPKLCEKCEKGLRSIVTNTCGCICQPCEEGTILCPTSNICINETYWCNGIQDCPDDEINCAITTQYVTVLPTEITTSPPKEKCPKLTCPPNFKAIQKKVSKTQKYHSYLSPMFSTYGKKTTGKTYSGIKTKTGVKGGGYRKHIQRPKNLQLTKKLEECPEYTCIYRPTYNFTECPAVSCPTDFIPVIEEVETKTKSKVCAKFSCHPKPPPDAVCNITGRTFNTFDQTQYKYDICNHILARDLENDEWEISLKKNCTVVCLRDLIIHHENNTFIFHPDLSLEFDGFKYTVDQTKKIGSHSHSFSISRLGNTLLFVSNRYGFWIIWDKQSNVKIGVVRKLLNKVDGLCGYFNDNPDDDKQKPDGSLARATVDFGDSWLQTDEPALCETKVCPSHLQDEAFEICNLVKEQIFEPCSKERDTFISRCLETTCLCLESAKNNETAKENCRCDTLQTFIVDCLTTNPTLDVIDWRMQHDCPAMCEAPLVHHDCYQRRCEPTCDSISDSNSCPKLPNVCFPGCYCPSGYVRNGDDCIEAKACRDCECNVLPHLQYVTYDEKNFTINGNCVYVMSRDEAQKNGGRHKFQVLITNTPCKDKESKTCVGKVTILYEDHKMHILNDYLGNKLKIIVDGERLNDFTEIKGWAEVKQTPTKHIKILLNKILISVSIYFPSLGVSVKAPSLKYGGHLEGLCGDCNKSPDNDLSFPNGTLTDDVEEFGLSWLYENLPGGQSKEACMNKVPEECPPLPVDSDPCLQLLDIHRFGQCHPLLDPIMFVEWCKKDTCGNHSELACTAIETYARDCMNSGFCVNWHSDLCPAKTCPPGLIYEQCGPSCPITCENRKDDKKKCRNIPVEGCNCPEGKVLLNDTCVDPIQCEVCDEEGHHPGDKWEKDACTTCSCEGTTLKCEIKHCPQIDTLCESGFTAIKTESDETKCCDEFICVPEATASPVCEPPQKLICAPGQIMKIDTTSDGCQQFICRCKPKEDCDPIDTATEEPLEDGYERIINTSGCCPIVETVCNKELCPAPQPCPQYHIPKEIPGKCCPHHNCIPPKDKCIYEPQFTADEKGGERSRSNFEKHKILINANDTWQDGPCRDCKCLIDSFNSYHSSCSKTECPLIETAEDNSEYVLEPVLISGQCCPNIKRVACKDENKIYKIGEKWQRESDYCTTVECIETTNGIRKQTQVISCDTSCDLGSEYKPPELDSKECCGSCKPVACVVDGIVRNVGEEWISSDFCTNYFCLRINDSLQVQTIVTSCTELSEEIQNNYVMNTTKVEGECCPKYETIACKEDDKVYQVGEKWPSPDGDKCKTVSCMENNPGKLEKVVSMSTCNSDCKLGWEYQESNTTCCGICIPIACVVDGVLKQPGENWTSSDNCTVYTCEQFDDQFTVTSQQESCPSIADCNPENIYAKGCCKHCNITTLPQSLCTPEQIKVEKSIGIIKQNRQSHGECKNTEPLQEFTECKGSCPSSTLFNSKSGSHESECTCCQATKYKSLLVELECEDGYRFKKQIAIPSHCGCEECASFKYTKTGIKTG